MNNSEQPLKRTKILSVPGYAYIGDPLQKYPPRMWATTIYCKSAEEWHQEVMNMMADGAVPWNEAMEPGSDAMRKDLASKCVVRVAFLEPHVSYLRSMYLLVKGG